MPESAAAKIKLGIIKGSSKTPSKPARLNKNAAKPKAPKEPDEDSGNAMGDSLDKLPKIPKELQ